ncbi:MAG: alcohol dehydrogenase catalytic domain-containing protein [Candidatus Calescibacterium sp.]|nr:alcohol dehydrogenase catalytic domain-containing protein [Candidatus Calescibacterium sp.]MDW8132418.1 alcohol dehydrogenase catalytic domain-containing protein [Candidatus Calescibacterium sp.]
MYKSQGYFVNKGKIYLDINEIQELYDNEVLLDIMFCGLCRTDLHIIDEEIPFTKYPIIPGHQIIGKVVKKGKNANTKIGDKLGIYWLYSSCGKCYYCSVGKENLCDNANFTGCTVHGGFQQYIKISQDYTVSIPSFYEDYEIAPLLCAGIIGYRALSFVENCETIGIYGFGSAGHIIAQIAIWQGKKVMAFIKRNDIKTAKLAENLGCNVYYSDEIIEFKHQGSIIFAPAGELLKTALINTTKGGIIVCAGIHMSEIPPLKYQWIWNEKIIRSVANVTREDAKKLFQLINDFYEKNGKKIKIDIDLYPIEKIEEVIEKYRKSKTSKSVVFQIIK